MTEGMPAGLHLDALDRRRIRAAEQLFGRAFCDYPLITALFPGSARRRARIAAAVYTAILRDCLAHGTVTAASVAPDRLAGIACWLPPGAWPPGPGRRVMELRVAPTMLRLFPTRVVRALQTQARLEEHHPKEPAHHYLAALAVDPALHGQGVGSRLLQAGLAVADAAGEPAFLETATPRNAAWYRSFGFADHHVAPAFDGGPTQWWLWRPAR